VSTIQTWLNIASVNDCSNITAAELARAARVAPLLVVYGYREGVSVGRVVRYEWRPPEDLWALCELDEAIAAEYRNRGGMQCESVFAQNGRDGTAWLAMVVLTGLPKGELGRIIAARLGPERIRGARP
jgi:hypothetical protein